MAGDMMLLMRGLAKLSQAVVETQSSTLRSGTGKFNKPFPKFKNILLVSKVVYFWKINNNNISICLRATALLAFTVLNALANMLTKLAHRLIG